MKNKDYWGSRLPQSYLTTEQPGTAAYEQRVTIARYRKHQYIKKFVQASRFSGKKVLEVGSGIGTDLIYFKKNGAEVTGTDITKTSVGICKKRFAFYGLAGNFKIMDAEELHFPTGSFDVVYSFGVLHHISRTEVAIKEIHRVLKNRGTVIVRINAKGWWYYGRIMLWHGILIGKLFSLSKQEVINQNTTIKNASPLVKYYSKREVLDLFSSFRIKHIKRFYLGGKFVFLPYWFRETILAKIFGNHWMIEAQKEAGEN